MATTAQRISQLAGQGKSNQQILNTLRSEGNKDVGGSTKTSSSSSSSGGQSVVNWNTGVSTDTGTGQSWTGSGSTSTYSGGGGGGSSGSSTSSVATAPTTQPTLTIQQQVDAYNKSGSFIPGKGFVTSSGTVYPTTNPTWTPPGYASTNAGQGAVVTQAGRGTSVYDSSGKLTGTYIGNAVVPNTGGMTANELNRMNVQGAVKAGVSPNRVSSTYFVGVAEKDRPGYSQTSTQPQEKVVYNEFGKPTFVESSYLGKSMKYDDYAREVERINREAPKTQVLDTKTGQLSEGTIEPIAFPKAGKNVPILYPSNKVNVYTNPVTGEVIKDIGAYISEKNIPTSARTPPQNMQELTNRMFEPKTYDISGLENLKGKQIKLGDTVYGYIPDNRNIVQRGADYVTDFLKETGQVLIAQPTYIKSNIIPAILYGLPSEKASKVADFYQKTYEKSIFSKADQWIYDKTEFSPDSPTQGTLGRLGMAIGKGTAKIPIYAIDYSTDLGLITRSFVQKDMEIYDKGSFSDTLRMTETGSKVLDVLEYRNIRNELGNTTPFAYLGDKDIQKTFLTFAGVKYLPEIFSAEGLYKTTEFIFAPSTTGVTGKIGYVTRALAPYNIIASKEIVATEEALIARYLPGSSITAQAGRGIINLIDEPFSGIAYKKEIITSLIKDPTGTAQGLAQYAKENPIEIGVTMLAGAGFAMGYRQGGNYLLKPDNVIDRLLKTPESTQILRNILYKNDLDYSAFQYFKDLKDTPKGMDFMDYTLRERIRLSPEQSVQLKSLIQTELDLSNIYKELGVKPSYQLTKDVFGVDLRELQTAVLKDTSGKTAVVGGSVAMLSETQTRKGFDLLQEKGLINEKIKVDYGKAGDVDVGISGFVAIGTQKLGEAETPASLKAKITLSEAEKQKFINVDSIKQVENYILSNQLNKNLELDRLTGLSDYQKNIFTNFPDDGRLKGSSLRKFYDLALGEKTDLVIGQTGKLVDIKPEKTIVTYHGTTKVGAENILREGLKPAKDTGMIGGITGEALKEVYTADLPWAKSYAGRAAFGKGKLVGGGAEVLKIEMPESVFKDLFIGRSAGKGGGTEFTFKEIPKEYITKLSDEKAIQLDNKVFVKDLFTEKQVTQKGFYTGEQTKAISDRLDLTGKDIDIEFGSKRTQAKAIEAERVRLESFPDLELKEKMEFRTIEKGLPQSDDAMLGGFVIRKAEGDLFVAEGKATQITTQQSVEKEIVERIAKSISPEDYAKSLKKEGLKFNILNKPSKPGNLGQFFTKEGTPQINVLSEKTMNKLYPGADFQTTIAHELIHYKQEKSGFLKFETITGLDKLPYRFMPSELLAFGLQSKYAKEGFKIFEDVNSKVLVDETVTFQLAPKKEGEFSLDLSRTVDKAGEAVSDRALSMNPVEKAQYRKMPGQEITFYPVDGKPIKGKKLFSYFDDLLDRIQKTEEIADVDKAGKKIAGEISTELVPTQFIKPNVEVKKTAIGAKALSSEQVLKLLEMDSEVVSTSSNVARRSAIYKQPAPTELPGGKLSYPEPSKIAEVYDKADYPDLFYSEPTKVMFEGVEVKLQSKFGSGVSNALAYISREVFPEMGVPGKDIYRRTAVFEGTTNFLKEQISKIPDQAKRERLTAKLNRAIQSEMKGEGGLRIGEEISLRKEYLRSKLSRARQSSFIEYEPLGLLEDGSIGKLEVSEPSLSKIQAEKKLKEFITYKTPAYKAQSVINKAVSELDRVYGGNKLLSNQQANLELNRILGTVSGDIISARGKASSALKNVLTTPYKPTGYESFKGEIGELYSAQIFTPGYSGYRSPIKEVGYSQTYYPGKGYSAKYYAGYVPYKAKTSYYPDYSVNYKKSYYASPNYKASAYKPENYVVNEGYLDNYVNVKPYKPYQRYSPRNYTKTPPYVYTPLVPEPRKLKLKYDKKEKKAIKQIETYGLFVRRRGQFKSAGMDLSLGEAKRLGVDITERTLARTFKIRKTGKKEIFATDIDFEPQELKFRAFEVKSGKKIRTPGQFIQRQPFSLSSVGEKEEIARARQLNRIMNI